ncbi:hypothetical protein ACIRQF_04560 [Streptomyces sp. NPDC101191]|uniref:hypothetical protein n=1 Tax=Streptomyces sp. NPDC101191 TaxID=3366126 RepID=UPI00381E8D98
MSEEIEGAAEKFARTVERLREELRAVAAAVAPGREPCSEERTDDRYSVSGRTGKRFAMSLLLSDVPYGTAAPVAADALRAAGWRTEPGEGFGGHPFLKATRPAGERELFEASVGAAGTALRISGMTPVVWIHPRWVRPPRAATQETLTPGHRLCGRCEGWGSCPTCEGLGFLDSRQCPECGLGMDCPDCRGTGQEPVPDGPRPCRQTPACPPPGNDGSLTTGPSVR